MTAIVLSLAMGTSQICCYAETEQTEVRQRFSKPTHAEVRLKHISQVREKLTRCKELLDNMQAAVEVCRFEQDAPRYAVKAEDMPSLRCIISQLQANPDFTPVRVTISYVRCLNLDFGEGVKLRLRA